MNKKHVRWLYRAMRCDMDDLVFRYDKIMDMPDDSITFTDWTFWSVKECSRYRSAFLHSSKSLLAAHRFHCLAMENRLEMVDDQVMIRVDLVRWFCEGGLTMDRVCRARDFHRESFLYHSCNQKY